MHPAVARLAETTRALLTAKADALSLTPGMIASIEPQGPVNTALLPVVELLPDSVARAGAETADVARALLEAARYLAWRQTYSEADGFDRRYLDTYGWIDLAGPTGPYRADGIRVMMGYWGQGLRYPDHAHPPEEHYLVLAGSAWFRLSDQPFRRLGPGEIFHTPPGAVHSAEMRDEALLALAIWRAEDLSVRINLTDKDRDVSAL